MNSIFAWTSETLGKAAGQEMTKAFGTVAGTIVGGLIAAAAVKGSTQAAPTAAGAVLAGAAGSAAAGAVTAAATTATVTSVAANATAAVAETAVAATGTAAARGLPQGLATGAVKTVGSVRAAFQSAATTAAKVVLPVAALGVIVYGTGSVVGGIRAARRKADLTTIDMISDRF
ncbi:MAG: hypothetical protein FJZ01_06175 [Candidatus Sericytochromatia bacterium]|nr:hypothetical protein [Candidatus Tanganyikabacteria bacterium]